jgi:hypothetical protein
MLPWEREIYMGLMSKYIEEENKKIKHYPSKFLQEWMMEIV